MEERSLRVYQEKTFFSKLTKTITKLLIPTKIGINGVLISIKRNNAIKAYEAYINSENTSDQVKTENANKKFEDVYALYLESIDKYILDSIYKKYYAILHLKETEYLEYKYKKQMYLLNIDYETVENSNKAQLIEKYKNLYVKQMESLYKGLLKHYSIKLADNLTLGAKDEIYNKIFSTLEGYIENILPLKMKQDPENATYQNILEEYQNFEKFTIGKLDQNDNIEKNMVLLALSRKLFTHSLPLIVAEQCYEKLLQDTRSLIVDTKVARKQEKAYSLLLTLIEEYHVKLLSTKIYWDKASLREQYKAFWQEYKKVSEGKNTNYMEYIKQKQILFLRNELKILRKDPNKNYKIIQFYCNKLVELGAMKRKIYKNTSKSIKNKENKNEQNIRNYLERHHKRHKNRKFNRKSNSKMFWGRVHFAYLFIYMYYFNKPWKH